MLPSERSGILNVGLGEAVFGSLTDSDWGEDLSGVRQEKSKTGKDLSKS